MELYLNNHFIFLLFLQTILLIGLYYCLLNGRQCSTKLAYKL